MAALTVDTRIVVYPFSRQTEGDVLVIGRPDTAVFLALPPEAVELLDYLAGGLTVGEAQAQYQAKYGEIPDLDDLLGYLETKGFVRAAGAPAPIAAATAAPAPQAVRYHFANFPQHVARAIFSGPVLVACGAIVALALLALAANPWIMPGRSVLVFSEQMTLMRLTLMALGLVTVWFHEMAHLIAARALGVSSRLGISTRMWMPVAETDMTGIWSVPRAKRYLPFLAGPLLDTVSASLLLLVLFADSHGWISVPPGLFQLTQAMVFTYLLRLLWQCYFFVRTDFYYVFANLFGCKNLMADTAVYMRNQAARFFPRMRVQDQSHIPDGEQRVIHGYALIWLAGRLVALGVLFLVVIPVTWQYAVAIYGATRLGYGANPSGFIDATILGTIVVGYQCWGLWMWLRTLRKGWGSA